MKVTIWEGCKIVQQFTLDVKGPDVEIDPTSKVGYVAKGTDMELFDWN